jgi:hypothetical protein
VDLAKERIEGGAMAEKQNEGTPSGAPSNAAMMTAGDPATIPDRLRQLSDDDLGRLADDLIVRSRARPGSLMAGPDVILASIYLGELNRRAMDKQTRASRFLAFAVAWMTLVQAIAAGIAIWLTFWHKR